MPNLDPEELARYLNTYGGHSGNCVFVTENVIDPTLCTCWKDYDPNAPADRPVPT